METQFEDPIRMFSGSNDNLSVDEQEPGDDKSINVIVAKDFGRNESQTHKSLINFQKVGEIIIFVPF